MITLKSKGKEFDARIQKLLEHIGFRPQPSKGNITGPVVVQPMTNHPIGSTELPIFNWVHDK